MGTSGGQLSPDPGLTAVCAFFSEKQNCYTKLQKNVRTDSATYSPATALSKFLCQSPSAAQQFKHSKQAMVSCLAWVCSCLFCRKVVAYVYHRLYWEQSKVMKHFKFLTLKKRFLQIQIRLLRKWNDKLKICN